MSSWLYLGRSSGAVEFVCLSEVASPRVGILHLLGEV